MEKKITLYKAQNYLTRISDWMNKKKFVAVFGMLAVFVSSADLKAQSTVVIPSSNEGSAFIGPFGNAARQLQLLIDDSVLTSLVGKNLTGISFRLPGSTTESWPPTALTMSNFNIFLSDSVEPGARQLDFAANVVGTQTQTRSGSLLIPAGALTVGSNPNDFSFKINFTNAWTYTGGNLLIEIQHSGTGISSRSVQAASTSSAGYGTLYSALWQSTGAVLQGNFCIIEITADGQLGAGSVKIGDQTTVYPNPVNDVLFIKSDKKFTSYTIYNMAGQQVLSQKLQGKLTVNVEQLKKGNYVLKLNDNNGNTEVTQFIKK